jgi:hypothetical protein
MNGGLKVVGRDHPIHDAALEVTGGLDSSRTPSPRRRLGF